jgi:hypothetical protein
MLKWLILSGLAAVSSWTPAQPSGEIADLFPVDRFPDHFYEVTSEQTGWGVTTGWVHSHWLGSWEASGEAQVTHLLRVTTFCDPDLRLPPVMEEITLQLDEEGLAALQMRSITAGLPDEVTVFPSGTWVVPVPVEEGREWLASNDRLKSWTQIVATDAPNPNRSIEEAGPCVQTINVTAERRPRGLVALFVTESWWARGFGPVQIIESSEVRAEMDWEVLAPNELARFVDERESMRQHATLCLARPFDE